MAYRLIEFEASLDIFQVIWCVLIHQIVFLCKLIQMCACVHAYIVKYLKQTSPLWKRKRKYACHWCSNLRKKAKIIREKTVYSFKCAEIVMGVPFAVYCQTSKQSSSWFNACPIWNSAHLPGSTQFPVTFHNAICSDLNTRVTCANLLKRSAPVDVDRCYLALGDNFKAGQMEGSVTWIGPEIKYQPYRFQNRSQRAELEPN